MIVLWHRLGFGDPTINEWHAVYNIVKEGYVYFTKWGKGSSTLIEGFPSNVGKWKIDFFFVQNKGGLVEGQFPWRTVFSRPRMYFFYVISLYKKSLKQTNLK